MYLGTIWNHSGLKYDAGNSFMKVKIVKYELSRVVHKHELASHFSQGPV